MRELTYIKKQKEKRVYQLVDGEFQKGEWCKEIPKGKRVEIKFTANNNILIVENTPTLLFKKAETAGGKEDENKRY